MSALLMTPCNNRRQLEPSRWYTGRVYVRSPSRAATRSNVNNTRCHLVTWLYYSTYARYELLHYLNTPTLTVVFMESKLHCAVKVIIVKYKSAMYVDVNMLLNSQRGYD